MTKLIITVGLPASGKSTWAKEYLAKNPTAKRINRDELRLMVDNGKWSQEREKYIKQSQKALAIIYIQAGFDVIVDDTNLSEHTQNSWKQFAQEHKAEFQIQSFLDVPVEKCFERDINRQNSVGKDVILRMYYDFIVPPPVEQNDRWPHAIITDLDGTLALFDVKKRSPYDRDFINDQPNEQLIRILNNLYRHENSEILIFSGRSDKFREETIEWLTRNRVPYTDLYMRPDEDRRSDVIFKRELFENIIRGKYFIDMVFDDRPVVVRGVWHWYGLPVFKYGPDYDF